MVFVAVGQHQTDDVFALLDQVADIRQDQIDPGQLLLGCKGHAAIDDQPLPPPRIAEAVDREVHPDLADAAERRKNKLVLCHHLSPARRAPAAAKLEGKHVARRDFLGAAAAKLQNKPAGAIEADEAAMLFA